MFQKLGVQLYSIRDYMYEPDMADWAFKKLAELGYTEAHTAGNDFDAKLFGELLNKNGIQIIGTHYSFDEIVNNPEKTMETHRMWGTTNVGIGGMPGPARKDLGELKQFILDFNRTAEKYAKEGFKLTYHNHHFEFLRIDGYKTLWDLLVEGLDPATTSFVLDTCWVSAAGGDVVDWMEKLRGRIDILHLKDLKLEKKESKYYVPTYTEVGYGNLSWDPIMAKAEEIGVKHYIVEQDGSWTNGAFNSMKMSADFLAKYRK